MTKVWAGPRCFMIERSEVWEPLKSDPAVVIAYFRPYFKHLKYMVRPTTGFVGGGGGQQRERVRELELVELHEVVFVTSSVSWIRLSSPISQSSFVVESVAGRTFAKSISLTVSRSWQRMKRSDVPMNWIESFIKLYLFDPLTECVLKKSDFAATSRTCRNWPAKLDAIFDASWPVLMKRFTRLFTSSPVATLKKDKRF